MLGIRTVAQLRAVTDGTQRNYNYIKLIRLIQPIRDWQSRNRDRT